MMENRSNPNRTPKMQAQAEDGALKEESASDISAPGSSHPMKSKPPVKISSKGMYMGLTLLLIAVIASGIGMLFWSLEYSRQDFFGLVFSAALIWIVAGTLLCCGIFLYLVRRKSEEGCTVPVTATVLKNRETISHIERGEYHYYQPVFQYWYDGRWIEIEYPVATSKVLYPAGSRQEILINPSDPSRCCIPGASHTREKVLNFLGGAGVLYALLVWIWTLLA